MSRLVVNLSSSDASCPESDLGGDNKQNTIYINHLGFMEDAVSGGQLFGITANNNHAGNKLSMNMRIFRAVLDPTSGSLPAISVGDSNY